MDYSDLPGPPSGIPSPDSGGIQRGAEHEYVHAAREGLRDSFDASRVGHQSPVPGTRPVFQFDYPDPLAAPPPRPGMEQRWIWIGYGSVNDDYARREWARATQQGKYIPRLAETVEHTPAFPLDRPQAEPHKQMATDGLIIRGGHILMERPKYISEARDEHFRLAAQRLVDGLEVNLQRETRGKHGGPGAHFDEHRVNVTRGDGFPGARRPPVD